jgi:hypothetical protein
MPNKPFHKKPQIFFKNDVLAGIFFLLAVCKKLYYLGSLKIWESIFRC